MAEGREYVSKIFVRLEHAEHARDQRTAILLPLPQDHAASRLAKLLIRTGGACAPLSVLLTSTDVSFLEKKLSSQIQCDS